MRRITHFQSGGNTYPLDNVQSQQDNFGRVVPRARKMIGKDGGFDEYGTQMAFAEVGEVQAEIVLSVIAGNLSDMQAKLNLLLSLSREAKGLLYMTLEDDTVRWCIARIQKIDAPQSEHRHTEVILRAQVTVQVPDPHWYERGTEAPAWGYFSWGQANWGGSTPPQAVSGELTEFLQVVSGGNVETQPRIVITCGAGQTAQNIKVQRIVDGTVVDEVLYTGTLVADDVLEISSRNVFVKLNGVDVFNNLTWLRHVWFALEPGENLVRVIMANAGDAASITLNYWHKFV